MIHQLKKHKRLILTLAIVSLVVLLTACGQEARQNLEPIGPNSEGFWEGFIPVSYTHL